MLVTRRGLGWGVLQSAHVWLLAGGFGLIVTSCGGSSSGEGPASGGGSASGGKAAPAGEFRGKAAGGDSQGQLAGSSAGFGPVASGRGGAGPGGQPGVRTDPAPGAGSATTGSGGSSDSAGTRYPGQGFIVHEWGTDTIVVGSDGSLQRGLHHEEEDLPSFVYDRIKAGILIGSSPSPSVIVKMETPVTYFYSPAPLSVTAKVDFPKGVLTQWYPAVAAFLPMLAGPFASPVPIDGPSDPALDPNFPFASEMCRLKFGSVSGGRLDWGTFSVQAREAAPEKPLVSAPLEQFGWSYARDVDANLLTMSNGENERFLFYRGLGEFDLPVKVQAAASGKVTLTNGYSEAVGHVFLLNVNHDHGAFVEHSPGIATGGTLEDAVPSLEGAPTLDEYSARLASAVTRVLDASGLYHDEAVAMVNTWRRQWFRTPGVRALYLLPQSWTDQSIPLTITPKPDATVRVMLIRVELITKEQESADVSALAGFDTAAAGGAAYFSALGRFAEPRLRRALQLSASVAGEQYLSKIASAKSSVVSGE
jgi:hypothetical protein